MGGGGGLLFSRRVRRKGLGIGLIAGWVVLSVATLGFATGLNPALYS
ncbi:hypothetical protein [Nonomuraea sp. NPDC050310]